MLFPSALDQEVFTAVYVVWIAVSLVERGVILSSGQGRTKTRADGGSALLIYASVLISIFIAYSFAYTGLDILADWLFYLGIVLMLTGMAVREWAVVTLRGYFSYRVRIREDHKVIEAGPYSVIRHPAYTGSILTIVGLGVALRSLPGIAVLIVFFAAAYAYRIRTEEKALVANLGEAYVEYMKRTKRLIPFVY